ncbi:ATP-binding protein [Streptomyces cavernae]|uniref:ATP-binding protein n=1 Tax=Streptomyces cavernae TaxID=2259034 RepID=UPI001EE4560F|nr:ATP-binding protein [Streptomyces cavernae]
MGVARPATGAACLVPTLAETSVPPGPEELTYSLTLPAALSSPRVARAATHAVLAVHGLRDMTDAAVQVVAELTACACRFAPGAELYVSLRYRDGTLRVTVFDTHPRHINPRLTAACDARRRAHLRLLACVVREAGGDWGFEEAAEPNTGTRMWATLPR